MSEKQCGDSLEWRSRLTKDYYERSLSNVNFEKEYREMRGGAGVGGPRMLEEARLKLIGHTEYLAKTSLRETYWVDENNKGGKSAGNSSPLSVSEISELLLEMKRLLKAGKKYVDEDIGGALEKLRSALSAYTEAHLQRLRSEFKPYHPSQGGKALATNELRRKKEVTEMQRKVLDLMKEFKALEILYDEINESIQLLNFNLNEELDLALQATLEGHAQAVVEKEEWERQRKMDEEEEKKQEKEGKIKKAAEEKERKKEKEEKLHKKQEEQKKKEEEEKLRREQEEQKKREEEEKLRRKQEERKKREEEEKLRREQEERKKKEEEEKLRREQEERKKREEEEKLRRKQEERKKREEEEKLRREQEERKKREEEEKLRSEQEERKKREEEEKLRREQEERKKREEEEKLRREQEERKKREEEEKLRREKEEEERRRQHEEQKRQEEKRRQEAERQRQLRDPRYFQTIIYELKDSDTDETMTCAIKASELVGLKKDQLTVTLVDDLDANQPESGTFDELVSETINVKPSDDKEMNFEVPILLALRYNHAVRGKEFVIKMQFTKPFWQETEHAKETSIQGLDTSEYRFMETPLEKIKAAGFNTHVVCRPRKDRARMNEKGGRLEHSVDRRNSVTIPPNAYRLSVDVSIQVIPVDSETVAGLKKLSEGWDSLLGSSPLVGVNTSAAPTKPITIEMANPSGGNNNQRAGLTGAVKDGTAVVSLLTKESRGKWSHRDNISLTSQKDSTTFNISELLDRMLLLRTRVKLESAELCKIATTLETSLRERSAVVVMRQSADNTSHVYIECTKKDQLNNLFQKLSKRPGRFADGPEPSDLIILQEGDIIKVVCAGNVKFPEEKPIHIIFNSNLLSASLSTVNVLDPYRQSTLEKYQGSVRFSVVGRPYTAPPKKGAKLMRSDEPGFLCELPILLPKQPKDSTKKTRVEIIIPTQGALSDEYLKHLSTSLGDEWKTVATHLGHDRASLDRIRQNYSNLQGEEAIQKSIHQMLVDWFKSSEKSKNKVDDLCTALREGGREDLAGDLQKRNQRYRMEIDRSIQDSLLQKYVKAFTDSPPALKQWRVIAKELGLSPHEIVAIGGSATVGAADFASVQQVIEMLTKWFQVRGESATRDSLSALLKKLKLNEAASR